MFQAETLDHVAFPVRDLPRSEKFYLETVGLAFMTQRKNADGSPRHTYVKAGENIVGLTLPGVAVPASASGAPRYALAMPDEASFDCRGRENSFQRREMFRRREPPNGFAIRQSVSVHRSRRQPDRALRAPPAAGGQGRHQPRDFRNRQPRPGHALLHRRPGTQSSSAQCAARRSSNFKTARWSVSRKSKNCPNGPKRKAAPAMSPSTSARKITT